MEVLFKLLESGDEKLEKRGLQDLCELLEKGLVINSAHLYHLYRLVSRFQKSQSIIIRRWLYKTIGLLKERKYLPFLKAQLADIETDEENKSWIVAAIYHITNKEEANQIILKSNINSSASLLAAGYFEPEFLPKEKKQISKILDEGNILSLKWFGLLYGDSLDNFQIEENILKDLVTRLNLHEDNGVAEYSIWAIHKSKNGNFSDSQIATQNFFNYPPNIRRWLYRLLAKDIDSVFMHFDFFETVIYKEDDISAREGLAIGLGSHANDKAIALLVHSWFIRERNKLVRIQLLKSISINVNVLPEFQKALKSEVENPEDKVSKLIAIEGLKKAKQIIITQSELNFPIVNKQILLVVATETEMEVIITKFKKLNTVTHFERYKMVYWNLGQINNSNVLLVKSSMGYSGSSGSILTITDAIRDLDPSYIIMLGIAFGLKEDKQKLTEILVSRQLQGYELQKVDKKSIIPRGDKISASTSLLSRFENSKLEWKQSAIHFGLVLSGEKLSNNKDLVDELKNLFPEAIGGEMEGLGLQSVSQREKKDWILIKGICDWGYDKDDLNQMKAMENATDYLIHTLQNFEF